MSWNGESRAIKEAIAKAIAEGPIERDKCVLCGRKANVHANSRKYDRVLMLCQKCTNDWLSRPDVLRGIPGNTPADQLYTFLYFDNPPSGDYGSTKVAQLELDL